MKQPKKVLVTCPNCGHSHQIEVDVDELEINNAEREYDLSQVMRLTGLSRETLKRYIYNGRLKASKNTEGGKWMVSGANLAEFRRNRASNAG